MKLTSRNETTKVVLVRVLKGVLAPAMLEVLVVGIFFEWF